MTAVAPSDVVRLLVNGTEYAGWKSVRIEAGIERQARSFDLEVTDRWPGQTNIPRRVQPGDACQVYVGDDLVLTGYVDATPIRYDGRSISVSVRGRSKTADLVDCCPDPPSASGTAVAASADKWGDVIGKDGKAPTAASAATARRVVTPAAQGSQWRNQKLESIAAALARPYGITVLTEVDTGAVIPAHSVQVGESVFESIDRMMRIRHVLSTDNARGELVFIDVGSAGRATTAIRQPGNVLAGDANLDYKGVFSTYICKGQRAGTDDEYGPAVAEGSATSTDPRAKRRRVLVIKQSGQADEGTCSDRVEYERAHRAAKALETRYTLRGWRQADGTLWQANLLVQVHDPMIGFDAEMVIAECRWILDAQGQRTEITVGPPDGYRSKAGKLKASKSQKGGGEAWSDVK